MQRDLWSLKSSGVLLLQALLLCGTFRSIRHTYAEGLRARHQQPWSIAAAGVEPGNAETQLELARAAADAGDLGAANDRIRNAKLRSPANADLYIQSALLLEQQERNTEAEQDLLTAATLSNGFSPRWTLANFYFRHGPRPAFFTWVRRAQLMAGDRLESSFHLCSLQTSSVPQTLRDCIANERTVVSRYVQFLMAKPDLDGALFVAREYPRLPSDLLLELTDAGVQAMKLKDALPLWQELSSEHVVPAKACADCVSNGDFTRIPSGKGFDWHLTPHPSAEFSFLARTANITLDGKQPEQIELLWQPIDLAPANRYALDFELQTRGIAHGDGITWSITSTDRKVESPPFSCDEWQQASFEFAGIPGARLVLAANRRSGFPRIEGSISIRRVRLRKIS